MGRKESNQTNKQNISGPMQKSRKLLDPIYLSWNIFGHMN